MDAAVDLAPSSATAARLAERAERAERDAWVDLLALAAELPTVAPQVRGRRVGRDGCALSVPTLPLTLFNRVFGLGLEAACSDADLEPLPAFFAAAPAGRWAVQPAPGPHAAAIEALLAARGHAPLAQRIAKTARDLVAAPQPPTAPPPGLSLREVGAAEAAAFAAPLVSGFGLAPWFAEWLRALPGRAGWHCYAAWQDDGTPVAAAAMRSADGHAWLGMAATLPAARGRGAQRALMLRRLADASAAGCRSASSETGAPQPGQPHPSYSNMLGCGLRPVALRASWAPAAA